MKAPTQAQQFHRLLSDFGHISYISSAPLLPRSCPPFVPGGGALEMYTIYDIKTELLGVLYLEEAAWQPFWDQTWIAKKYSIEGHKTTGETQQTLKFQKLYHVHEVPRRLQRGESKRSS